MRDNAAYRDVPLAVGGDGPRSVLCTCNYLAREFGVRSAMPAVKAKQLCPDLLIVSGRMDVYKEVSSHIREIFLRYTSKIEPLSLDEAFLDVTDCEHHQGSATLIAEEIRAAIYDELNLTASAGIAPNKFLAKIASDENKPNGQCVISPAKVAGFVDQLPLKKIPGGGPKTNEKLVPHVIEPTFGVDRTVLAVLSESYKEEDVNGVKRVYLDIIPELAPYKIAVFPLLANKPELTEKAREVYAKLKENFETSRDDIGNIGKRYRRQDEIGTPFCVTIDFDTLKGDTVTVRERNTMKQERVNVGELVDYFKDKLVL